MDGEYFIEDDEDYCDVRKQGTAGEAATFWKDVHPDAKAAAEAEAARLNREHK